MCVRLEKDAAAEGEDEDAVVDAGTLSYGTESSWGLLTLRNVRVWWYTILQRDERPLTQESRLAQRSLAGAYSGKN